MHQGFWSLYGLTQRISSVALRSRNWLFYTGAIGLLVCGGGYPARGQPTSTSLTAQSISNPERPTLRLGSQGNAVNELQALLKLLGYYNGTVDGLYQDNTAAAVTAFQQAAGLSADGIVGSDTWNRLLPAAPDPSNTAPTTAQPVTANPVTQTPTTPATDTPPTSVELPTLRLGMRGPAVSRLQERLRSTGFFSGAIDGVFGSETESAVIAAQRRYQLDPDGIVGAATWTALLR
jgi:N-acetylmuramoyl-L-alanine amidase